MAFPLVANSSFAQLISPEIDCLMLLHIRIIFYPDEKASEISPLIIPHKVISLSLCYCLVCQAGASQLWRLLFAENWIHNLIHIVVFFSCLCCCCCCSFDLVLISDKTLITVKKKEYRTSPKLSDINVNIRTVKLCPLRICQWQLLTLQHTRWRYYHGWLLSV